MVRVESAGLTDIGRKRESNEDCIYLDDTLGLYLVADGMGGHRAGGIASSLVVNSIRDFLSDSQTERADFRRNGCLSNSAGRLLAGIEWSNQRVHETALAQLACRGMGSTVAALYFAADTLISANVGDSPIYLIRNRKIEVLSVQHTLQADMGLDRMGPYTANMLTRAVGPKITVEADMCELNCFKDDVLILCSDGLSNMLSPREIMSIAEGCPPVDACRRLVDRANERGGDDNISAVMVRVLGVHRHTSRLPGGWIDRIRRRLTPPRFHLS